MPRGGAEGTVKRIRGQGCRMRLGRQQPSKLLVDVLRSDARGVEERGARHQLDNRRARRDDRAAPGSVEPRAKAPAVELDADRDQVATSRTAGGPGKRSIRQRTAAPRPVEMLLEGTAGVVHELKKAPAEPLPPPS